MVRKKEDPEKVKIRVKRYLETKQQLLITGLSDTEKESFVNLAGLETLSHAKKLLELINHWQEPKNTQDGLNLTDKTIDLIKDYINFKGISADNLIFDVMNHYVEHDDKYKDFQKQNQINTEIKALIDQLLSEKPLYNTTQNKAYWKERLNDEALKIALKELNIIDSRIEKLFLKNYISITKNEIIDLTRFPEPQKVVLLKKTLELTNYGDARANRAKPKVIVQEKKTIKIENWTKFEKDFNDFLGDVKWSKRLESKLRTKGKRTRANLETNNEYYLAFKKICSRIPENILKNFKPMYRQGYFNLYESEIIEIAKIENLEELLLVLYESLRRIGSQEPVTEAKQYLGLI
jgi:hypothetical protein